MTEATRLLTLAEVKARKAAKASKSSAQSRRFAPGLAAEVLQADAILLLGLTQALRSAPFIFIFIFMCDIRLQ